MNTPTGQKRRVRIVVAILLISMLLDKYFVSQAAPWLSGLFGVTPLIVFLDIPADLPFTFGLVPVLLLFCLLYTFCYYPYQARNKQAASRWMRERLWRVVSAILIIPLLGVSGGAAYMMVHDRIPRQLRNAIESLGANLDLHSPWPGHEIIHLRGSMVMAVCLFFGIRLSIRRIRSCMPYQELPLTEPVLQTVPGSSDPGQPESPAASHETKRTGTKIYVERPAPRPVLEKARLGHPMR